MMGSTKLEYFQASASGAPPVMRPADYWIGLLSRNPINIGVANRGYIQLRYQSGLTKYTLHVGLAKRFTGNINMLRFLIVRAESMNKEHPTQGLVLVGDPSTGSMGYSDGSISNFQAKIPEGHHSVVDSCYRILAGFFNAIRELGILSGKNSIPFKRLLGFCGSPIIKAAMGSFLEDPLMGFSKLMRTIGDAIGDIPTPTQVTDISLDRYFKGREVLVRNFLNGMTNRNSSRKAWYSVPGNASLGEAEWIDHDPLPEDFIGDFRVLDPDGSWITLEALTELKAIDDFVHQYRLSRKWRVFLSGLRVGSDRDIYIPIGEVGDTYFVISWNNLGEMREAFEDEVSSDTDYGGLWVATDANASDAGSNWM